MAVGNPISLTDNVASRIVSQIATASQTDFTISGGYRLNAISVYRNGVRLISGRDYSAADGSTVVLLSPATVSDALEFHIFDDFRVADAIVSNASHQNIEGNLTVTGILTASNLIGSNLELQSLTVTNDVSIGGTLTYQDVTNIDSVGIITARTDVHVGAGLSVIGVSTFHGNAIFNGNVDLGNASGDTITATGRFDSDLIPSLDDQKDLGSATVEWRDLYLDGTANIDTLSVSGNSTFTGNLGIGTDNPDEKLEVYGGNIQQYNLNASGGTGLILQNYADGGGGNTTPYSFIRAKSNPIRNAGEIRFGRDSAYGSAAEADSHISFWTALNDTNTERLRITSAGLVGIGTDNPNANAKLHVIGGLGIYAGSTTNDAVVRIYNNGSESYLESTYTGGAGYKPLVLKTGGDDRLTITAAGSVGIGTTNPGAKLHVEGYVKFGPDGTSNQYQGLSLINGRDSSANVSTGYIDFRNNLNTIDAHLFVDHQTNGGSTMIFGTSPAGDRTSDRRVERLRITDAGSVKIGSSNVVEINPSNEYPTIRPTLDFNFAATKILDPTIIFTRDGVGTFIDELGIIRYASNNVPRFNHDPITGESLGLLIEESRTNILGLSSDLTDNNGNDWDNINGTIAVNQTTAPDGTTTAASFTASAGNAEHSVVFAELVPVGNVTVSVWVKTNTYSIVSFVLYGEANSTVSYNISTKTVYNQGSNVSRAKIIEYPNGWYRIVATMNCTVANSRTFRLFASTGNFNAGGSESFYYWGPQLESGSFETSYIPTYVSNTSVTRGADNAKITGTNFTDFYNETEGTLYSEFSTKVNTGTTTKWVVSIRNSTNNNNYIAQSTYGSTNVALSVQSGGSTVAYVSSAGTISVDQFRKVAGSFKLNDFDAADNGLLLTGDTSGAMPTGLTRMDIGSGWTDASEQLEGHIKSLKYYNKKLTDAQLQGLTQQ